MSMRVSRRKLANVIADKVIDATTSTEVIMTEVAAYLVETGRVREQHLLVRDIEEALAERGIVIADITTAVPLNANSDASLAALAPTARKIVTRNHVDESIIAGVRVEMPGQRLDDTVQHKIAQLRALKV